MLECTALTVAYGPTRALDDFSIEVAHGDIVAVMGESGSGKSTLLRVIAGLVQPDSGSVSWQGNDVTELATHLRRFGLMFQDYALFPHLSVGENVAFGLRMDGATDSLQRDTVIELLELVGLSGYESREIGELSGGEQQRVALARTLAPRPALVLLDEPLGALDRARRDQLLADMQRIFAEREVTALYVTHDHQEAFAIADRVAVMNEGRLVAQGSAEELWSNPRHIAAATLLGFPTMRSVEVSGGRVTLGGACFAIDLPDGAHHLAFTPGALTLANDGAVDVTVIARRFEGGTSKAVVELAGHEFIAEAPDGVMLGQAKAEIDPVRLKSVVG